VGGSGRTGRKGRQARRWAAERVRGGRRCHTWAARSGGREDAGRVLVVVSQWEGGGQPGEWSMAAASGVVSTVVARAQQGR
jgi:hypothetical protein